MILKIALSLAVLVAAVVFYGFLAAPKSLTISRSILINASLEKIFPYANNPRSMQEWNPFTEGDPTLKMSYDGPEEGVGASSSWEGNSNTGKGKATIVAVEPLKKITVKLDFVKPFEVTNYGEYRLDSNGASSTLFTWTIVETATIPRFISCFVNLEKVIGGQFEKGLAKLKKIAENN